MQVKQIKDEDVVNYKKCSMFIGTCYCDFKCCKEAEVPVETCQNSALAKSPIININNSELVKRYRCNGFTSAIVFGGLEPILQLDEITQFLTQFRDVCDDDVVIYTGYKETEIKEELDKLKQFKNIIIKFGRYQPNQEKHYDEVLGVYLASDNQYGRRIS